MAQHTSAESPDYKALFEQAEEGRQLAEEQLQHEADLRRQAEERNRATTFDEYISACHTLLSAPLQVGHPSRSTKGSIPAPTGKYCPTRLREWTDFPTQQALVYNAVRRFLQPTGRDAPRLFSPLLALEEFGRVLCQRPISSEKDLEGVERYGKDRHADDIVTALCQIPSACEEFRLGRGLRFDSHPNSLDEESANISEAGVSARKMQPDQFCVHRLDDGTSTLLMTVEYKPPHKLSVQNLCAGLRPMDFWEEIVNPETIPTDGAEKLSHNAARLTGAALVQEYHVMIQEGLVYSCVSTGIALVFLYIPEDEPTTLYYYLCVPNKDAQSEDEKCFQHPVTAVARLLCLCLMSCQTSLRTNAWRNKAKNELRLWKTDFEYARSQIPDEQLHQTPPGSEYVPSSPIESSAPESPRRITRSHARCTPPSGTIGNDDSDPSDSDSHPTAPQRKRNYSEVASSPPQPMPRSRTAKQTQGHQRQHSISSFCTQRCLLGLQQGGLLDDACPNLVEHRGGKEVDRHPIAASELVRLLNQQLDVDLDHYCEPFGSCGAYGAPFKIRCASHGYTIVGKGTTAGLWGVVSREAAVYEALRPAQGSAVPVFLGSIDLKETYFLHGAGEIRHMLLMAWGGEPITDEQWKSSAIDHSNREIRKLGVWHCDLRRQNVLWSAELKRMILIDFHSCKPITKHLGSFKRKRRSIDCIENKRPRMTTT